MPRVHFVRALCVLAQLLLIQFLISAVTTRVPVPAEARHPASTRHLGHGVGRILGLSRLVRRCDVRHGSGTSRAARVARTAAAWAVRPWTPSWSTLACAAAAIGVVVGQGRSLDVGGWNSRGSRGSFLHARNPVQESTDLVLQQCLASRGLRTELVHDSAQCAAVSGAAHDSFRQRQRHCPPASHAEAAYLLSWCLRRHSSATCSSSSHSCSALPACAWATAMTKDGEKG